MQTAFIIIAIVVIVALVIYAVTAQQPEEPEEEKGALTTVADVAARTVDLTTGAINNIAAAIYNLVSQLAPSVYQFISVIRAWLKSFMRLVLSILRPIYEPILGCVTAAASDPEKAKKEISKGINKAEESILNLTDICGVGTAWVIDISEAFISTGLPALTNLISNLGAVGSSIFSAIGATVSAATSTFQTGGLAEGSVTMPRK